MRLNIYNIFWFISALCFSQNSMAQQSDKVVDWDQVVGLRYDSKTNLLVKTASDGWGNAGAFSKDQLQENKDGYLEFIMQDDKSEFALGLSSSNIDNHYRKMDYAFYYEKGTVYIFEKGRLVGQFGRYKKGDRFRIHRKANFIQYVFNGVEIYKSQQSPNIKLYADLAVSSNQAYVDFIKVSQPDWIKDTFSPIGACTGDDDDYNWIETKHYDLGGNLLTSSKVYSDKIGKVLQTQTLNVAENVVFASQPVYDVFGRPVLETMSAPTYRNYFCYDDEFIQNVDGDAYSHLDFDKPNETGLAYSGEINQPKQVKQTDQGKLGWYYSNNNSDEPLTPTTRYPYSRVEYSKTNPGQVRRSAQPGNYMRMGKGHEAQTYIMPASTELYYVYGYNVDWDMTYYDDGEYQLMPINLDYQVIKTINVDNDGKEFVSFTDHDGKTLATCVSGVSAPIQTVESLLPKRGHIDIHLPENCSSSLYIHYPGPAEDYTGLKIRITNLATDEIVMHDGVSYLTYGQQANLDPGYYRIEEPTKIGPDGGISVSYQLNYEHFTLHFYDKAKRLIKTIPPLGIDQDYTPEVSITSLMKQKKMEDIVDEITIDEPSDLVDIHTNRLAHLMLQVYKPTVFAEAGDDVIQEGVLNSSSTASRLASQTDDRVRHLGEKRLTSGGINKSPIVPMPVKYKNAAIQVHNDDVNDLPYTAYVNVGVGDNIVTGTNLLDPYMKYYINYKLGYEDADGEFVTVKDNLQITVFKNYKIPLLDGTIIGTSSDPVYSYETENSTVIINHFDDLKKYQVQIVSVNKSGIQNNPTPLSSPPNLLYTGIIPSSLTEVYNSTGFGLRFDVDDYYQLNAPEHTMEQTYDYNSLSWLLSTTTPDEGTSRFVYRNDGQIRFSQSAEQNVYGHFSYTNYDKFARPIESGEYKGGEYTFQDHYSSGTSGTHEFRELTGGLYSTTDPCVGCENQSFIVYDVPQSDVPIVNGVTFKQSFVNGNVAKTENEDVATWYSYDYAGRVVWLIKEYKTMPVSQKYKTWEYEYDVNNGNLLYSHFQKGTSESFAHRYEYDENNRLLAVFTNKNEGETLVEATYEQARYVYYKHGPLKRVELAGNLQGIDYVYRLNGALKSINNPSGIKNLSEDPGQDGLGNGFQPDQFAMSLDYYSGDYSQNQTSISGLNVTASNSGGTAITSSSYVGNVTSQRWLRRNNTAGATQSASHRTYVYNYDYLNRLDEARFGYYYPGISGVNFEPSSYTSSDNFKVQISYDENGNIKTLKRNQDTGATMDNLSYTYNSGSNQLQYVNDSGANLGDGTDFEDQNSNNYIYDASGRLIEDKSQLNGDGIVYTYNIQGLVTEIKNKETDALLIKLSYDDSGFRYRKQHYDNAGTNVLADTWYVRDVSGKLASVYVKNGDSFEQREIPFYGASRIGLAKALTGGDYDFQYELKDHLGNVRQTILTDNTGNISTGNWSATSANYYPFGMKMPNLSLEGSYRFGYQGEYAEDETNEEGIQANSFQLRLYDSRIGRWLNPDPKKQYFSPYLAMGNNPINGVDPDGGFFWKVNTKTGELIYEEGDNEETLAYTLGISPEKAKEILSKNGFYEKTEEERKVDDLELTSPFAISFKTIMEDCGFNCWGSAKLGLQGLKLSGVNGNITNGDFDLFLVRGIKPINGASKTIEVTDGTRLVHGKTFVRYARNQFHPTTHVAIFYARDSDGVEYWYSKDGPEGTPQLLRLEDVTKAKGNDNYGGIVRYMVRFDNDIGYYQYLK